MQARPQTRCQGTFCFHLLPCQDQEQQIAEQNSPEFSWVEAYLAVPDTKHHMDPLLAHHLSQFLHLPSLLHHLHNLFLHQLSLFLYQISLFLLQLSLSLLLLSLFLHQLMLFLLQLSLYLLQLSLSLLQLSQCLPQFLVCTMWGTHAMQLQPSKSYPLWASIPSYWLDKLQ